MQKITTILWFLFKILWQNTCRFTLLLQSLLSAGSTLEDPSRHNWKIVNWDVKNQIKQTNKVTNIIDIDLVYYMPMITSLFQSDNKSKSQWWNRLTQKVQISQHCMRKIVIFYFLSISQNMFWCSKELLHWDCSFEYLQHMFLVENIRKLILITLSNLEAGYSVNCLHYFLGPICQDI